MLRYLTDYAVLCSCRLGVPFQKSITRKDATRSVIKCREQHRSVNRIACGIVED